MLKKHLAVMLLLVMTVAVFGQSIPSGTGRYEALGNSPFILDAATDINHNPAWTNYYRNYAFGDLGRDFVDGQNFQLSGQYAGATFGVGKKLNLGMILNKSDYSWGKFNSTEIFEEVLRPSEVNVSSPIVPFKGLIGYTASKNFHLGLAPYYAAWSSDYTDTDTNATTYDRSSSSLGSTLGFVYLIKKGWVEGALKFGMNKYKSEYTEPGLGTTTIESEGGIEFGADFRAWIYPKTGSKLAIVPVLGFSTYSWNPKLTSGSITATGYNYSWLNINGGVGINIPVMDDIQLAGGLIVEYNTSKADSGIIERKNTHFILPRFHLAGETSIADWLTARFGYSRAVDMSKVEGTFDTRTVEYNDLNASDNTQTVSLGAGFHFGRFSIDATVSERWLKSGINFVSGTNNDLFGVISASYNFNN
jgi:hypothetical protein